MATQITFNDGAAATLTNGKTAPGDRLTNFVPMPEPIGVAKERLSDGLRMMFKFRDQYGASFSLTQIPVKAVGGVRLVDVAARLVAHLLGGGTCGVTTGDVDASTYPTCGLAPGSRPSLVLSDKVNLEYTLTVSLINVAGSPVAMVCHYV